MPDLYVSVKNPNSLEKTFEQLSTVAKVPLVTPFKTFYPPEKGLRLSPLFWRHYGCHLNCAGCCRAFTLNWLPDEWNKTVREYPHVKEMGTLETFSVNGVEANLVTIYQTDPLVLHDRLFCTFINPENGACGIHRESPFSCKIEMVKFERAKGTGHILKTKFGRGWAMMKVHGEKGAICTIDEYAVDYLAPEAEDQLFRSDIPALKKMLSWAEHWEIPTYLPELLALIDRKYRQNDYGEEWIWRSQEKSDQPENVFLMEDHHPYRT